MKTKFLSSLTLLFILFGFFCIISCGMGNKYDAQKIVDEMQFGWNLGNTLDAHEGAINRNSGVYTESCWGKPKTTQEMIKGLAKSGIKTIRLPVTWHNHIKDTKNYTVAPDWMKRVKEITDWAIAEDMYVILNIHHDTSRSYGYYPDAEHAEVSAKFLTSIWTQICETFNNDYDEHLVFEVMNEPRLVGNEHEWAYQAGCEYCEECMHYVNEYNQLCIDVIRATGGNNAKRLILFPSIVASPDSAFNELFKIPEDSAENALALSVHMYTPYPFAMGVGEGCYSEFSESDKANLDYYFRTLNEKFTSKGIPVVIGEMGATNKDNLKDREEWISYFVKQSKNYGMTCCLWDNQLYEPSTTKTERYGYYDRENAQWYFPSIIKAAVKASKN